MSLPRLPFLYPHLFKQSMSHETYVLRPGICHNRCKQRPRDQRAGINTSRKLRQETYAQRYGTATEPQSPPLPSPGPPIPPKPQDEKSLADAIEKEVKAPAKQESQKKPEASVSSAESPKPLEDPLKNKLNNSRDEAINTTLRDPSKRAKELDASESHPAQLADTASAVKSNEIAKSNPLETVLEMGPPAEEKPDEHRAPHLQAPPYVHHFDTFTLVRDLERGGFTEDQSVTIMKAVRGQLAINLDVAKESLVSKSDVENETYLFRAACSELRTEILNTRKSSSTKTRTQLSHLQHTYDILNQRVSQETLALKDDLRGMLNDRRMSSRDAHQNRDSEISELNNIISVRLNSDSKSEVENLRWVLTRRAAMAIGGMALLILGSLRYSSYKLHELEIQARKQGAASSGSQSSTTGGGSGVGHTVSSREIGTQTGGSSVAEVDKAENVGFVSLG